ncbi:MAG: hypothetical protein SGBAC_008972 [Bacillariaceae sp.]
MPSLLKRLRSFRPRKSFSRRSSRRRKNKQKIEPPNSPSSILQIDEIQRHEIPAQSSRLASLDDGISQLSIPSLIEDADVRVGGTTEARNEERSFEAAASPTTEMCSLKNDRGLNTRESVPNETNMPQTDTSSDEVEMKISTNESSVAEKQSAQDSKSVFPYKMATEVPAKCPEMIGKRVKVRDSLKDARKRSKIGYITGWKDSITVTMECDNGDNFGVRLSSIELVGMNGRQSQPQSIVNDNRAEMRNPINDQEGPNISSNIHNKSTFPYLSPTEVPCKCPSIIGKKVKVKDSLSDSKKRGQVGKIVEWKTRNTVSVECEDGQKIGVRLFSIDFVNHQHHGDLSDETSSQRSPESFKSAKAQSTETFVTARMDFVDSSHESNSSNGIDESAVHIPSRKQVDVQDQVMDKVKVPTATLAKAPTAHQTSSQTARYNEPIAVPAKDDFMIGKRVQVKKSLRDSKKRGKFGSVVRWKNKSLVEVKCDDGNIFGVRLENIDFALGHTPQGTSSEESLFTRVKGPVSRTSKRGLSNSDASKLQTSTRRRLRESQQISKQHTFPESDLGKGWNAPQNPEVMPKFGGFRVEKLVVRNDEKEETTFLNNILKQRKLIVEVPLSKTSSSELIERRVEDSTGQVHELVSCKTYTESTGSQFVKRKIANVVYAQTQGPGLASFAVDDYLLRVGDFTTIPPRKVAARLELFQSPSSMNLVFHDDSWFRRIPDLGYVGGGFIHEDTLFELLQRAGMKGDAAISRVAAIQVRLFIPSMGVFKGMLVKKRVRNGAPIELPSSMQKVVQSSHPQRFDGSCILICRHKVHPSPGSANEYIGRNFDVTNPPPEKSFTEKIKKPLSQMIFRLWETLGVPKDLCYRYKKESLRPARRNHAWVVGVPDPTGCLPPDTVFVPGIKNQGPYDLFVTRCPCYAHEHGRKFRSLTEKPATMSTEDWDWLHNKFNFGAIIFSNPRPGMMSIPERIANGDLDGDLYLICWDKEVVDTMTALPLVDHPTKDDGKLSTVPSNPNWFRESQDVMIENLRFELGYLIGALYKAAEKIANKSDKKLGDPDALALFEAYNEALEYQKHGRPIRLPSHLIDKLKPQLRSFIQPLD